MRRERMQSAYMLHMTRAQISTIMIRDGDGSITLREILSDYDCDYNHHFGYGIFYILTYEQDMPSIHKRIKEAVLAYIE